MKKNNLSYLITTVILAVVLVISSVTAQTGNDSEFRQFVDLVEQVKFRDALPIGEKMIAKYPKDADVHFYFAKVLIGMSKIATDPQEGSKHLARARQMLIKAKEFGATNAVIDALISSIPVDGVVNGKFSKISAADAAMNEAERFFAEGKMDKAFEQYQLALSFDPLIYEAALFSGDIFLGKSDWSNAELWYRKAINIDPFRETAYRYSATPFMRQNKYDEARDRYIDAFITEPYSKFAVAGFTNWATATNSSLGHPKLSIPKSTVGADGKKNVDINIGLDNLQSGIAWMAYVTAKEEWKKEKFAKTFPNEKKYRHSVEEEVDALKDVLFLAKETKDKKKGLDPEMKILDQMVNDGVLEAYIYLTMMDQDLASKYRDFLGNNREKLRLYVSKYVIHKK